jgi:hypothetical protein
LFDMVHARGYAGSPHHFRHRIAALRPRRPAEAFLRLRTLPGEQSSFRIFLQRAWHRQHLPCPISKSIPHEIWHAHCVARRRCAHGAR